MGHGHGGGRRAWHDPRIVRRRTPAPHAGAGGVLDGTHGGDRGQFRRFAEESGFVTDAEKPDGETQVFDTEWDGYHLTTTTVQPWKSMRGKSWCDPNWSFPNRDDFPVVCVSYDDMRAFCCWLTRREAEAGRLPEGLEYRGGNSFDVPGNARCAVRLGIRGVTYSDSRDGFRVCLGRRVPPPADPR